MASQRSGEVSAVTHCYAITINTITVLLNHYYYHLRISDTEHDEGYVVTCQSVGLQSTSGSYQVSGLQVLSAFAKAVCYECFTLSCSVHLLPVGKHYMISD